MKLEGSLDAFSLPDVFQLLSLTKKSGGLHLTNGQSTGAVHFTDGLVSGAVSDASRQSLARRLVGLGACDDSALRRAVERASSEDIGVSRALLQAGAVDPTVVTQLALEQAIDAVFDLVRWPAGDFSFAVDEPNRDDVGLAVSAEQVVAEAGNRRDTWEAVSRIIPSPEVVLTMPVIIGEGPTVTRTEWSLLALVDGRRSVGELVELSGSGQFAVVSTLASLVQRGMLGIHDEDSPDHASLVRRRQQLLAPLEAIPLEATSGQAATPTAVAAAGQPGLSVGTESDAKGAGGVQTEVAHGGNGLQPKVAPSATPDVAAPAAQADPQGPTLGGAHQPANVVPPRPEPFLPKRDVEHPEPPRAGFAAATAAGPVAAVSAVPATTSPAAAPAVTGVAAASGGAAPAAAPMGESAIERDPTVNRSLMLRLIAGVRGL